MLSIMPFFYHTDAISSSYNSKLQAETVQQRLKTSDAVSATWIKTLESSNITQTQNPSCTSSRLHTRRAAADSKGYRSIILSPLHQQKCATLAADLLLRLEKYAKVCMIRSDPVELSRTAFSSNSNCQWKPVSRENAIFTNQHHWPMPWKFASPFRSCYSRSRPRGAYGPSISPMRLWLWGRARRNGRGLSG